MKKRNEWDIFSIASMRQMEEKFNEETCIETLWLLSGDQGMIEMPHYDTLNDYLEKLSPGCLSDLRKKMVKSLRENSSAGAGCLENTGGASLTGQACSILRKSTVKMKQGKIKMERKRIWKK